MQTNFTISGAAIGTCWIDQCFEVFDEIEWKFLDKLNPFFFHYLASEIRCIARKKKHFLRGGVEHPLDGAIRNPSNLKLKLNWKKRQELIRRGRNSHLNWDWHEVFNNCSQEIFDDQSCKWFLLLWYWADIKNIHFSDSNPMRRCFFRTSAFSWE